MVPIALSKDGRFDEEGFKNYLLDICKEHKEQKRALAFAFLVYDFDDYTIQQIIENKKYWTTLDKISGHSLSLFYINSQDSYYTRRQKEIYDEEIAAQERAASKGYMQMIQMITLQATPLDKSVTFLKQEFKLDDNLRHPFVLFFQSDGEDILDCFVVTLKQEKLEDAFLELKRQIEAAVDAVSKVTPNNFKNHQEIFNLIKSGVKGGNAGHFIKTKIISKIGIGTITSFIKLISGRH
jgi:hypothetical protein